MEKFKGKFLIRKAKQSDGTKRVVVCGVAFAEGALEEVNDADEMWVMECEIKELIKFKPIPETAGNYSPEDFLGNVGGIQHPIHWIREGLTPEQHLEKYCTRR